MRFPWRKSVDPESLPSTGLIDPHKILFSVSTICDEIPVPGEDTALPSTFRLHEDDWRQIELVAKSHRAEVDANFEAIRAIESARVGAGYRRVHVRAQPRAPLAEIQVSPAQLERAMSPTGARREGIAFANLRGVATAQLRGGIAYVGDTTTVYAIGQAGRLQIVGAHVHDTTFDATREAFLGLSQRLDVWLVDWLAARTVPAMTGN